jgi:peroxiredoxin
MHGILSDMFTTSTDIPDIHFGQLKDGEIISLPAREIFAGGTYVLVGMPGVFTPICTNEHMPSLIEHAGEIKANGIDGIYVVSDDNVWALDHWKRSFKNHEQIEFISDGNHSFLKETRLYCTEPDLFLKAHYGRFYAVIKDNMIRRVRSEVSVLKTVSTDGQCILSDIADIINEANIQSL